MVNNKMLKHDWLLTALIQCSRLEAGLGSKTRRQPLPDPTLTRTTIAGVAGEKP